VEVEIDAPIFAELDCKAIDKKVEVAVPEALQGVCLPLN